MKKKQEENSKKDMQKRVKGVQLDNKKVDETKKKKCC